MAPLIVRAESAVSAARNPAPNAGCLCLSPPGYTAGTPYKVPPTQSNNAPPPYSPSPNPYQTAMYPIRSAYPQQNLYTQVRASLLASRPGQPRILRGRGRGRQRRPRGMEGLGWGMGCGIRSPAPLGSVPARLRMSGPVWFLMSGGISGVTPLGMGSVPPELHPWEWGPFPQNHTPGCWGSSLALCLK